VRTWNLEWGRTNAVCGSSHFGTIVSRKRLERSAPACWADITRCADRGELLGAVAQPLGCTCQAVAHGELTGLATHDDPARGHGDFVGCHSAHDLHG
jgi:hypothetical protein